jgi:hypothetical protein
MHDTSFVKSTIRHDGENHGGETHYIDSKCTEICGQKFGGKSCAKIMLGIVSHSIRVGISKTVPSSDRIIKPDDLLPIAVSRPLHVDNLYELQFASGSNVSKRIFLPRERLL